MARLTFKKWFEHFKPDEETTTILVDGYTQIVEGAPDNTHYYLVGEAIDKLAEYEDKEEQGLLLKLPIELRGLDKRIVRLAILRAMNIAKYGVDLDKQVETATELSQMLNEAYLRGRKDEVDRIIRFQEEAEQKLAEMKG